MPPSIPKTYREKRLECKGCNAKGLRPSVSEANSKPGKEKLKFWCYTCGGEGHIATQCSKREEVLQMDSQNAVATVVTREHIALSAKKCALSDGGVRLLDCAASDYMTYCGRWEYDANKKSAAVVSFQTQHSRLGYPNERVMRELSVLKESMEEGRDGRLYAMYPGKDEERTFFCCSRGKGN
ncbi:hypothetical protein J437_LFUL000792 [Ladona fulva]|uniref:CCHC-type domain-containing protein n=1 Tax=Ladona fulva TaxID=123851 RepID=A0A8K0KSB2_LADFU|nr:hypothetical protein J437_LFUL000792 [Ladona fulva]